ncbi:desmethyl-deoxy-podophyllotoxin synthase-like isoform X2 [Prosopis cineraria]|uniref:desmethyl-deoxy-podophyllotoxin synthase-like isoform X2 n=1 Tax=Prosopis cineraria TaxID=364024 RepID=UPI00240FC77B|nr:desmethyl-deoxy-podophyllotoxin synthase-like isoform X2 [Prosopis cineraria]
MMSPVNDQMIKIKELKSQIASRTQEASSNRQYPPARISSPSFPGQIGIPIWPSHAHQAWPHLLAAQIITYGSRGMTFSPYGSYWRQMRKICTTELLAPKRVESFRSIREKELSNLVQEIKNSEGSVINLSEKISSLTYGLTSMAAFGGKSGDQEAYSRIMKDVTKVASGFSNADIFPSIGVLQGLTGFRAKLERVHNGMDMILENIVNDHRNKGLGRNEVEGEEDLVDVLLRLQRQSDLEHPLSNSEVKATIMDIFSAGSDTTLTTIDWAMSELVKNPRMMEKAQSEARKVYGGKGYVDEASIDELKYLKSVIKETMRLHAPVPLLLPRECSERCEINGFEIPCKSKVIVNAWAIGRDPNYWVEAERFYPERFHGSSMNYRGSDFQFIPFGAERRICPGIIFGIAGVELSLANFLFHFDWKLPDDAKPEDLDMSESFGLSVKRKQDLLLIPKNSSMLCCCISLLLLNRHDQFMLSILFIGEPQL